MATLAEGDKAPDFALRDQHGDEVKLSDLRGQTVVVNFYPRAEKIFTEVCPPRMI